MQFSDTAVGIVGKDELLASGDGIAYAVEVQHGLGIAVVLQGLQVSAVLYFAGKIGIAQLF